MSEKKPRVVGRRTLRIKDIETLEAIKALRDTCALHDLTFAPTGSLTEAEISLLEAHQKARFQLWFDSWVTPKVNKVLRVMEGSE